MKNGWKKVKEDRGFKNKPLKYRLGKSDGDTKLIAEITSDDEELVYEIIDSIKEIYDKRITNMKLTQNAQDCLQES